MWGFEFGVSAQKENRATGLSASKPKTQRGPGITASSRPLPYDFRLSGRWSKGCTPPPSHGDGLVVSGRVVEPFTGFYSVPGLNGIYIGLKVGGFGVAGFGFGTSRLRAWLQHQPWQYYSEYDYGV